MPRCTGCAQDRPTGDFNPAWSRCRVCVNISQERALSNYVLAMSEQVVETPYGWCTARCAFGDPMDWLCLHIHQTREDAETCLRQTLAEGRGIFPIR
jgi:hypothetical protein